MTNKQGEDMMSPWVGPRPYEETERETFYGRGDDTRRLRQCVEMQRLVIISAPSGVGKSSLIQAGLLPTLRRLRNQNQQLMGCVLVLRNWGALRGTSPLTLFRDALDAEIERLPGLAQQLSDDFLKEDARLFKQAQTHWKQAAGESNPDDLGGIVNYMGALCKAVGSLVLVVDQAEELLGSGFGQPEPSFEEDVFWILGSLFKSLPHLTLIISLREEYLARLRRFEDLVGPSAKRIFHVEPLYTPTVRELLEAAVASGRVFIDETALQTLTRWVAATTTSGARGKLAAEVGARLLPETSPRPVDLLRFQCLLSEIHAFATSNGSPSSVNMTPELLERFRDSRDERILARDALKRYADGLLNSDLSDTAAEGVGAKEMRRMAARMMQLLSSPGGFKRHVEANELVLDAAIEDLDILRSGDGTKQFRKDLLNILGQIVSATDFQSKGAGLFPEQADEVRSGAAREEGWSIAVTAGRVVAAAKGVIAFLIQKKVLKPGLSARGAVKTYELVHDGFGPALNEWAESYRESVDYTLGSVVAHLGANLRWHNLNGPLTVNNLVWRGCTFVGVTFRGVRFTHCDFRGSIFRGCIIERCEFVDCNLSGALFLQGTWTLVSLSQCNAEAALIRDLQWERVCIQDRSRLTSATLVGLKLVGDTPLSIMNSDARAITFDHCFLGHAIFKSDCKLQGAIFRECNLANATFEDCNLSGSVFENGEWCGVRLASCRALSILFRELIWSDVDITNSICDGATFEKVKLLDKARFHKSAFCFAQMCGFLEESYSHLELTECDMRQSLVEELEKIRNKCASGCRWEGAIPGLDRVGIP